MCVCVSHNETVQKFVDHIRSKHLKSVTSPELQTCISFKHWNKPWETLKLAKPPHIYAIVIAIKLLGKTWQSVITVQTATYVNRVHDKYAWLLKDQRTTLFIVLVFSGSSLAVGRVNTICHISAENIFLSFFFSSCCGLLGGLVQQKHHTEAHFHVFEVKRKSSLKSFKKSPSKV